MFPVRTGLSCVVVSHLNIFLSPSTLSPSLASYQHGRVAGPHLQQTCSEDLEEEQVQTYGEDNRKKDRQELVSLSFSLYILEYESALSSVTEMEEL